MVIRDWINVYMPFPDTVSPRFCGLQGSDKAQIVQVRKLGALLDVPQSFLKRHPFPGPGLAVRIIGDVTEGNALETVRLVCTSYFSYWM